MTKRATMKRILTVTVWSLVAISYDVCATPPDYGTCADANPVANVISFSVAGRVAGWTVVHEIDTKEYVVEGCNSPDGLGEIVATTGPGRGHHQVVLSNEYPLYRLVEVETSGKQTTCAMARPGSEPPKVFPRRQPHQRTVSVALENASGNQKSAVAADPPELVIFTTGDFATAVTENLETYWELTGRAVEVVDVSPYPVESRADSIKSRIAFYANNYGTLFFELFGTWYDDLTSQMWNASEHWLNVRQGHLEHGRLSHHGDTGQHIPTFMVSDLANSPRNVARLAPYITTDQPYGDLDGDGVPDVVVARLPVTSVEDVVNFTTNVVRHNSYQTNCSRNALFLLGDVTFGNSDGETVRQMANAIKANLKLVSPGEPIQQILESENQDAVLRNLTTNAYVNFLHPEFIQMLGTFSSRFTPAHYFWKSMTTPGGDPIVGWSVYDIDSLTVVPLVMGASCYTVHWTEPHHPVWGRPVSEDFLFADGRGAVAWIGPHSGSSQLANFEMSMMLAEEVYANPHRAMGESWLMALRRAYVAFDASPAQLATVQSYTFMGSTMAPFRPAPKATVVTQVRKPRIDGLLHPHPEVFAVGCPQGDEDTIIVSVTVDTTRILPPIQVEAITMGQPGDSTVVFYETFADSAPSLVGDEYRTTFTISHFGGCGVDSAEVRLFDTAIGNAHINVRSPDYFLEGVSWGKIDIQDFTQFGNHHPSSPCDCIHARSYNECLNFGPAVEDTLIDSVDFTLFGNNWQHEYTGGAGGSVSPALAYSSGTVDLKFEEDYPLLGQRKLRVGVSLSNVEQYQSIVILLKNDNPKLSFFRWVPHEDYQLPTMAAAVDRRAGVPEIILGVIGGKNIDARFVNIGTIEMDIASSEPLELTEDDLALVDVRLHHVGGGTLTFAGTSVSRSAQPTGFRNQLAQNYPNPFNPSTTIAYSIERKSRVELQIFNVRGQLVKTLVDTNRTPNVYRVIWDGRNNSGNSVASGVYFYRLTAGEFRATKKMVLLR